MKFNDDLRQLEESLRAIERFEYSVSQPQLGSVFNAPKSNGSRTPLGDSLAWMAHHRGVSHVFPSTSGTTPLNNLMMLTLANPDATVLIQRNSHISLLSGAIHLGAKLKYIVPEYNDELGISLGITPKQLDEALTADPSIDVVILTYPTYFGVATDIVGCGEVVHKHGKVLGIDGAHGAYFMYHPDLPNPAEASKAAIITQSNHKVCATMSQASMALLNSSEQIPDLPQRFYEVVNQCGFITTSFSYPILSSLFLGEYYLVERGQQDIDNAMRATQMLRERINTQLEPLKSFGSQDIPDGYRFDPLRVTVNVSALGMTGFEVANELIEQHQIYPEMETLQQVLFLFTPYDRELETNRVYDALCTIVQTVNGRSITKTVNAVTSPKGLPKIEMSVREVFYAKNKCLKPLELAIGCISAETIATYPPGSATIVAGERITSEAINFLTTVKEAGGILKGVTDPKFEKIRVIEE